MHVNAVQATFLRGTSALAGAKRETSAAADELEELDDELLETRCRRNGLSKKGGRDMQVIYQSICKISCESNKQVKCS